MAFLLFYYYSGLVSLKNNSSEKIRLIKSGASKKGAILLKITVEAIDDPYMFNRLNNSEFVYKGKLYDIISEVRKMDTVYILCLHDKSEEDFHKRVASVSTNNSDTGRAYSECRTGLHLNLKTLVPDQIILNQFIVKEIGFKRGFDLITQNYSDVPSPPPKVPS